MTPNEFTAWLDGFLDGKDSLTADQIATLRAKAEKLMPLKGLTLGSVIVGRTPEETRQAYAAPTGNVAYTRAES